MERRLLSKAWLKKRYGIKHAKGETKRAAKTLTKTQLKKNTIKTFTYENLVKF